MAQQRRKPNSTTRRIDRSVPLFVLLAFALGAGTTWLVMRNSSEKRPPAIESFLPDKTAETTPNSQSPISLPAEPPDVSRLTPADAERVLGDWNYDHQSWQHAIEHYQKAIARGADTPDVRTDLGNCYRFLGQLQLALEQYQMAQSQNPQHENSLFNQISLYADLLHDRTKAAQVAQEFLVRFPSSPRLEAVRKQMAAIGPEPSPK